MSQLLNERKLKIEAIIKQYEEGGSNQDIVAKKFGMKTEEVRLITQGYGYKNTRKVTYENAKPGEIIDPIMYLDEYNFLDKYPMENYLK